MSKNNICKKITIVGMGLLGGSIGKACVDMCLADEVTAVVRRKDAIDDVKNSMSAHSVTLDLSEGVRDADLIVLAVPINQMKSISEAVVPNIKKDAVITDVGSVKEPVVASLEKIFDEKGSFVGSHPMAGKEKSGIAFSDKKLFDDAVTIVTPTPGTNGKAKELVVQLWRHLGSKVIEIPVGEHDKAVAAVSHLPHIIAASLICTVAGIETDKCKPFSCVGPSFRDVTRIASSSPAMWTDILASNRSEAGAILDRYIECLKGFKKALEDGKDSDINSFLESARRVKEEIV